MLDRLLGDPRRLDGPALARAVRRGSEDLAVRALRALGERDEEPAVDFLVDRLGDPRAAVRRAAAAGLGHLGRPRALDALRRAAGGEGTDEGQLGLAIARVRCGEAPEAAEAALRTVDARLIETWQGPRSPALAIGNPPLAERLAMAIGGGRGEVRPRAELLARRRAELARDASATGDGVDVMALAMLQHPDDTALLVGRLHSSGRRGEHAIHAALGMTGDPLVAGVLREALRATDVDPGRGFAQRRIAATALGRLGLRAAVPWLTRALEDEAHDYEGRPGAGLGIQYPVRTNLLWALGEIGDPASAPVLLTYVADTHGSAFGGFYLPALDALRKVGAPAVPLLERLLATGAEIEAANALGVLVALGRDATAWRDDARRTVRDLARRVAA